MDKIVEHFIQFVNVHSGKVPDMVLLIATLMFAIGICYGIVMMFEQVVFKNTREYMFSRKWRETDAIITCSCCNEEFADEQNYWVNKLRYTNTVDGLTYEYGRYSLLCWY